MTTRRTLLLVAGTCWIGTVVPAFAQTTPGKRRIAYLGSNTAATVEHLQVIFRFGLRELGWIEGHNLILDLRFAENDPQRAASLTAELLALRPDIFVSSTDREARAAAAATRSIPVVFAVGVDPVGLGLVDSLARPGRNVTGISVLLNELNPKRLQLLKEALPRLENVGLLFVEGEPSNAPALDTLEGSARRVGVKLLPVGVRGGGGLDAAFERLAMGGTTAALQVPHSLFFQHRQRLAELAIRHRIAVIGNTTEQADAGVLLSYGADLKEATRRLAPLVDRILRGADPATIPVEQANVYELVINLRTARTLGVELPRTLLLQATRVIQ